MRRSSPSCSRRGARDLIDSPGCCLIFFELNEDHKMILGSDDVGKITYSYPGSDETPFQVCSSGVPRVWKIRLNWSVTVDPGNKGLPAAISKKIHPIPLIIQDQIVTSQTREPHHMSIEALYSVEPNKTSGGRYHRVTTSFEYVFVGTDLARASPKSASFNSPLPLMRRFWGFRSL